MTRLSDIATVMTVLDSAGIITKVMIDSLVRVLAVLVCELNSSTSKNDKH